MKIITIFASVMRQEHEQVKPNQRKKYHGSAEDNDGLSITPVRSTSYPKRNHSAVNKHRRRRNNGKVNNNKNKSNNEKNLTFIQ